MTLKGSLKEKKGPKEKENLQPEGSVRKWWELSPLSTMEGALESLTFITE